MKICRFCLSPDVPDAASHCRHCGKRLVPSQAPKFIILTIIFLGAVAWGLSALRSAAQRDFDRRDLKGQIEVMQKACNPSDPFELRQMDSTAFEKRLAASSLDPEEQNMLSVAWDNADLACHTPAKPKMKTRK